MINIEKQKQILCCPLEATLKKVATLYLFYAPRERASATHFHFFYFLLDPFLICNLCTNVRRSGRRHQLQLIEFAEKYQFPQIGLSPFGGCEVGMLVSRLLCYVFGIMCPERMLGSFMVVFSRLFECDMIACNNIYLQVTKCSRGKIWVRQPWIRRRSLNIQGAV